MITANNISKKYGSHVLFEKVSFSIGNGILYIHGKSGCGKSTLLQILMGNVKPDEGMVGYAKEECSFSYCGQEPSLLDSLSLEKNIKALKFPIDKSHFSQLCKILNFNMINTPLRLLSDGERQKAEIIACLSKAADIFFLDEPFSSLDKDSRSHLVSWLNIFSKNKCLVLVNNDDQIDDIDKTVDIFFANGRININTKIKAKESSDFHLSILEKGSFCVAFKSYFKSCKWYALFQVLLCALSMVFFSVGVSLTNTKSEATMTELMMNNDPFSAHAIRFDNCKKPVDVSFYNDEGLKGYEYYKLSDPQKKQDLYLYGVLKDTQNLYYYSNLGDKNMVSGNQTVTLFTDSYQLEKVTKSEFTSFMPFETKFWNSLVDDYRQSQVILCSNEFIDKVLRIGPDKLRFSIDTDILFSCFYYTYSLSENRLYPAYGPTDFIETSDYYLSVPSLEPNKGVITPDGKTIYTTSSSTDGKVHLSLNSFKFLLMNGPSYMDYSTFGYFFNDEEIKTIINEYNQSIIPFDIYYDYSMKINNWIYYSISGFLMLLDFLFIFLSQKGKTKWFSSLEKIYRNQKLKTRSLRKSLFFVNLLEEIPGLIISFLLYFLYFIPKANYDLMVNRFSSYKPEGFYFYSQEPLNPYYDNLVSPIKIITPEWIILVLIVLFLTFSVVNYYALIKQKKSVT